MKAPKVGRVSVVRVIYRRFKDGSKEVIALLPDNLTRIGWVGSYMHVGQHGDASAQITQHTEPASDKDGDVLALHWELTSLGYNLRVMKRLGRINTGRADFALLRR